MIKRRTVVILAGLFAIFSIAGCAVPTGARSSIHSSSWRGRLSVRVDGDPADADLPGQSLTAGFELVGAMQQGQLLLFTPLGSTAAVVDWRTGWATLRAQGQTREFTGLDELIKHLLGTPVPVAAMFAWLDGQPVNADGWEVDLSNRSQGKIVARRLLPTPAAELRLVLEDPFNGR